MSVRVEGSHEKVDLSTAKSFLKSGKAHISPSGGLSTSYPNERHLLNTSSIYTGNPFAFTAEGGAKRPRGRLSFDILRLIYHRSAAVRSSVNFVASTLSSVPYRIKAVEGKRVAQRDIRRATNLITHPRKALGFPDTFDDYRNSTILDLMVLDHGTTLKHKENDRIQAFEALDAATVFPKDREDGRLKGWEQQIEGKENEEFDIDDIVHYRRFSTSDSLFGAPPIEAIVHEVSALLNASKSFSASLDSNQIPPGVLFLTGAGDRQVRGMKSQFEEDEGFMNRYKLRIISGPDKAKWIPFMMPNKDMETSQLVKDINRSVWRVLGVDRLAMNDNADINRSTSESAIMTRNQSLIKPILDLLANRITFQILNEINRNIFIEFFYFARTGAEEDLIIQEGQTGPGFTIRPTGKTCHSCKEGVIVYEADGETAALQCPNCKGTGRVGTYESADVIGRPTRMLNRPTSLADPKQAWHELSDAEMREKVAGAVDAARSRIKSIFSRVDSRDTLISATKDARNVLASLFDATHSVASSVVERTGNKPSKRGLQDARARIQDMSTEQIIRPLLDSDGRKETVEYLAQKGMRESMALADLAPRVAGSALSDLME